jgi:hypothetical protein
MDLNGARRKNATRETTSTLKAWLNEHKKNPYPTKGEKIMLAIITKMTLTQVSTWFANARRRLKKENKMTWEPRNRVEDDDVNLDDDDHKSNDDKDLLGEQKLTAFAFCSLINFSYLPQQIQARDRARMATDHHEWISWSAHVADRTATGTNRETAAGRTHPTSTTDRHIPQQLTPCSTRQFSTCDHPIRASRPRIHRRRLA